jgi:ABC-2 type transport system permease protein
MRPANVLHLGLKELRSFVRDPIMVVLTVYSFTFSIYTASTARPETLNRAPIAIVDEDRSQLSMRLVDAFYPPYFVPPVQIGLSDMDARMDAGLDTFALVIPPDFQRNVLAGRSPALQLNVDATRTTQAFNGSGYVQSIVTSEIDAFLSGHRALRVPPVDLAMRVRFNPELNKSWFGAVVQLVNQVTMLSIVLTGAALLREREHGTIEHLLAMPVTPLEIMTSKLWSMALVVLLATTASLYLVVRGLLGVPIEGSVPLFLAGAALHLFATTALGIFLGTVARTMPQFALLLMLVLMPLQILSGGSTPRESMPQAVQIAMLAAPTTHFVLVSQAILFRGAGVGIVWPNLAALVLIGAALFGYSLARFRRTIGARA